MPSRIGSTIWRSGSVPGGDRLEQREPAEQQHRHHHHQGEREHAGQVDRADQHELTDVGRFEAREQVLGRERLAAPHGLAAQHDAGDEHREQQVLREAAARDDVGHDRYQEPHQRDEEPRTGTVGEGGPRRAPASARPEPASHTLGSPRNPPWSSLGT
jgi:hypothetical protein